MRRTRRESLATIQSNINKMRPVIENIVESVDPAAFHVVLLDILSHRFSYDDFPEFMQKKLPDVAPEIIVAEQELLDEYNDFKQMLLQLLRNGYRLDVLKMLEAGENYKEVMEHLLIAGSEINGTQDLATDSDFFDPRGSTEDIYTNCLFCEIIENVKRRQLSRAEELNDQGYEHAQRGNYHQALLLHKQAVELSPNFHLAWVNAGIALENLGDPLGAIGMYDYVIENIDSNYKKAWHNKAIALHILGRTDEAIKCCKVALEIDPYYDKSIRLSVALETASPPIYPASSKTNDVLFIGTAPELYAGLADRFSQQGLTSKLVSYPISSSQALQNSPKNTPCTVIGPLDFSNRKPYVGQISRIARSLDWSTSNTQRIVEVIQAFLEEDCWDPPIYPFVALVDKIVGGFVFVSKTCENEKWWELHFIGVDKNRQRTGVGYLLLSSVYKYIRTSGGDTMIISVNPYATVATKFFQQSANRMGVRLTNLGTFDNLTRLRFMG